MQYHMVHEEASFFETIFSPTHYIQIRDQRTTQVIDKPFQLTKKGKMADLATLRNEATKAACRARTADPCCRNRRFRR